METSGTPNKLRSIRMSRGLSLDQLVEASGGIVSKAMLSKYENDQAKLPLRVAVVLAETLKVGASTLTTPSKYSFEFGEFAPKST